MEDERRVGLIGRRRSTRHIIFYGLSLLLLRRSLVRPPAPAPPPLPPTDLRYLAQMLSLSEFTVIGAQVWYNLVETLTPLEGGSCHESGRRLSCPAFQTREAFGAES